MAFGLTFQGFNPQRIDDVKADLEDAFRTAFGQNVPLDAQSVNGQVIGIFSERFAILWELSEHVYSSAYLDGATGAALDDKVAKSGITRRLATSSVVVLDFGGVLGTPIPVGSLASDPDTGQQWITTTAGTVGVGPARAEAISTGPIPGLQGTIIQIDTPIAGWSTVINNDDADLGRNVESDAALRERFRLTIFSGGGSSVEAVRGVLLRLDDVTKVLVVENNTDTIDSEGRPPKSIEAIVSGGDEHNIAVAIWFSKPGGIEPFGTNRIGAVTDIQGDKHDIPWTRPEDVQVWIEIGYEVLPGFEDDGEEQILAAVLAYGEQLTAGDDFIPWNMEQGIEVENMLSLASLAGLSANPTLGDPLGIDRRQVARVDSGRVKLTRLN